jgi:hypothetical protein
MTTIPLNVPVIHALKARLDTDLASYITDVNASLVSNGVDAETPQQILDYLPTLANLNAFPTIGIADGEITFQDDIGRSATGMLEIAIAIFVRANDRHTLAWRLRHLMAAVASCVLEGRDIDGVGWGVILKKIEPGPVLRARDGGAPDTVMGMRTMVILVRDEQDDY